MAADPYQVLGVEKGADQKQIRKAYRKLARKHHPDLNPDDKSAQAKFQEVSNAFAILGDEEKRTKFDRGEIDAGGEQVQQQPYYRDYAEAPGGFKYGTGAQMDERDFEDLFGSFFTTGRRGSAQVQAPGRNERYTLDIEFLEAARGASKSIGLPSGKRLTVNIPPGVRDGQTLRLQGQGEEGFGDGPAGDALITLRIKPDLRFRREGRNVHSELEVDLHTAVLGGEARVNTVQGPVMITIPPGSNTGATFRLKEKGIEPKGNHFVHLKIVLEDPADEALAGFLKKRRKDD